MNKPILSKPFGSLIPFTDPPYYQGSYSLYFNQTHFDLRDEVKSFVDEYIMPYVEEWEIKGEIDPSLYLEFGKRGYLCAISGQKKYPVEYTDIRIKSVPPEKFDIFHEMIIQDEIARCGHGGTVWFLMGGYNISAPAIFNFGSEALKKRVLPDILAGKKRCCLAITEPDAGSDVANLHTTAELSEDGKTYTVIGTKKWITNGIFSDYFITAVRTGGKNMSGISVLFIERDKDVSTNKMMVQGVRGSGTTLLNFEETQVPKENIMGELNKGFQVIMSNFNHERLGIIVQALRLSRVCIEESMKWAHTRETFGEKLINHAVIRNKLGWAGGKVETIQAALNDLVFQFQIMDEQASAKRLGGQIAALKAQASQCLEFCAREALQIFGGLGYSRGGKGGVVERIYRDVRAYAIPGGSEEIMIDLAVRQSLRVAIGQGAKL